MRVAGEEGAWFCVAEKMACDSSPVVRARVECVK